MGTSSQQMRESGNGAGGVNPYCLGWRGSSVESRADEMAVDALRWLVGVRPGELRLRQAIVLGWCDGPLEGFLGFADPDSRWHFRSFAHQHNPDAFVACQSVQS
ncbi:hypothetical protein Aglo03_20290 [Actinokineospora globicatena]|uniref:Uncharacterized protein n=1 Tax=Actinokineospora globicatena TaxID=103729 RepID=A0A9W6QMS4_9PSEU|nr:hypothetical protein Aglo03_20290 [Actinokineospora globicatena]